ncbi:hypothetical protein GIB67_009468 [Kingdonia uniflora]|uniref:DUF4283 domain-containing protein n=1 Tax=Kingdonia uniflora TaxID=39325 RepID=A0A7J7N314_9MAGN|nr:hypothetical protein GIB67_009468 [Kingdonia uniflora]
MALLGDAISFASALVGKQSVVEIHVEFKTFNKDGILAIVFSSHDIALTTAMMTNSLIVIFSFGRPSVNLIQGTIEKLWGITGVVRVTLFYARHVLVDLDSEKDVVATLSRESLHVKCSYYKIQRWFIHFDPKKESPIVSIQIQLPHFKVCFCHSNFLKPVMNNLIGGNFVRLDHPTQSHSRPSTARMCIEIDLTKSYPKVIWIGLSKSEGWSQKVIYEKMHVLCSHCYLQGHKVADCLKIKKAEIKEGKKKMVTSSPHKPLMRKVRIVINDS